MTKSEAAKLVAVMCAAFPSAKVTPETSPVYERMLCDLDCAAANAAVEQLLATSKWMPTVAEIRERAVALVRGEVKPGGEAWGLVLRAIGRHGSGRIPGVDFHFADPVVGECVSAMSWRALCESENQVADRARFVELYDQLAAQHRRRELSDGLPAMQRFRALQPAVPEPRVLPLDEPRGLVESVGHVLKLVSGGGVG